MVVRTAPRPLFPSPRSPYSVTPRPSLVHRFVGGLTIDTLTSKQRAHLRSLAHHLKPILHVGAEGVTDAVIDSVREAFNTRELLKVKAHDTAPTDVDSAAAEIAGQIERTAVVQTVGRTMVLYRPFPDDPGIRLPR